MRGDRLVKFVGVVASVLVVFNSTASAKPIYGDADLWRQDDVYRPAPIYFLHGFGPGERDEWGYARTQLFAEGFGSDGVSYFDAYYDVPGSEVNYLHAINFHPSDNETAMNMIERNSSIDIFQAGDQYVDHGLHYEGDFAQLTAPSPGWASRVAGFVNGDYEGEPGENSNVDRYNAGDAVLVAHSMSGLAAREFLTYGIYNGANKIKKLVAIGTPHVGTVIANIALRLRGLHVGEVTMGNVVCFPISSLFQWANELALQSSKIDPQGDAVRDMAEGSQFLWSLNGRGDQKDEEVKYCIIASCLFGPSLFANEYLERYLEYYNAPYASDGTVSLRSQRAYVDSSGSSRFFEVHDEIVIKSAHTEQAQKVCEPQAAGEAPPLLQLIEETPRLEMTRWDQYDHLGVVPVYAQVKDVYFPAQCTATVCMRDALHDDTWEAVYPTWERILYPDDEWDAQDEDTPVGSFYEMIGIGAMSKEVKIEVTNVANEVGAQRFIYMPETEKQLLSKWRELFIPEYEDLGYSEMNMLLNDFWPSVSTQPVTYGGARFTCMQGMLQATASGGEYWGSFEPWTSLGLSNMQPAGLTAVGYQSGDSGFVYGTTTRAYVSYAFDALRQDLKDDINAHRDDVKIFFGFHNRNHATGGFVPELVVKKASFGDGLDVGDWGSGTDEVCRINGDGDQRDGSVSAYFSWAERFTERELPVEFLDLNGSLQLEIALSDEVSPPPLTGQGIRETAGYMSAVSGATGVLGGAGSYIKIVLPSEEEGTN